MPPSSLPFFYPEDGRAGSSKTLVPIYQTTWHQMEKLAQAIKKAPDLYSGRTKFELRLGHKQL
jgi:hypothetical protein